MIINYQCQHIIQSYNHFTNLNGQDIGLICVYHLEHQHSWGNSSGYKTQLPLFAIALLKAFSVRLLLELEKRAAVMALTDSVAVECPTRNA
jgi:hypothetical protein